MVAWPPPAAAAAAATVAAAVVGHSGTPPPDTFWPEAWNHAAEEAAVGAVQMRLQDQVGQQPTTDAHNAASTSCAASSGAAALRALKGHLHASERKLGPNSCAEAGAAGSRAPWSSKNSCAMNKFPVRAIITRCRVRVH